MTQEGRSPGYGESIRIYKGLALVECFRPNRSLKYVVTQLGEETLIRGNSETYDVAVKGISTTGSFEALVAANGTLTPICGADDAGVLVT